MTLAEELRVVDQAFSDLPPEDLDWLASQMTEVIATRRGDVADARGRAGAITCLLFWRANRANLSAEPVHSVIDLPGPDHYGHAAVLPADHISRPRRVLRRRRAAALYPADRFRECWSGCRSSERGW